MSFVSFDIGIKHLGVVYGDFAGEHGSRLALKDFRIFLAECLELTEGKITSLTVPKFVEAVHRTLANLKQRIALLQQSLSLSPLTHIFTENQPRTSSKKLGMLPSLIHLFFLASSGGDTLQFHNVSSRSKCTVVHDQGHLILGKVYPTTSSSLLFSPNCKNPSLSRKPRSSPTLKEKSTPRSCSRR